MPQYIGILLNGLTPLAPRDAKSLVLRQNPCIVIGLGEGKRMNVYLGGEDIVSRRPTTRTGSTRGKGEKFSTVRRSGNHEAMGTLEVGLFSRIS